jgi:hypothetical protein
VLLGPNGEFYGSVFSGGIGCPLVNDGCGVILELQNRTYTLLYSFCAAGG